MKTVNKIVTKIVGYILLTPALISVILFLLQLNTKPHEQNTLSSFYRGGAWTGKFKGEITGPGIWDESNTTGGGYTSALPFYFGLMAIAGAYLIKDKEVNNN